MKQKYGVDFLIAGFDFGKKRRAIEEHFQYDREDNPKGVLLVEF